jgi:hypothetical protein
MSRLEWLLSGFLGLLIIILAVVGLIWWRQSTNPPAAVQETAGSERERHSAQSAYELAQPVAETWATGAQLVEASATWPAGSQFDPQGADWSFIFYAPDQDQIALITVAGSEATLFSSRRADKMYLPVPRHYWTIDSPALIELALINGGQQFLREQAEATLRLKLMMDQTPAWQVELIGRETGQTLRLLFDAGTSQLLYSEGGF